MRVSEERLVVTSKLLCENYMELVLFLEHVFEKLPASRNMTERLSIFIEKQGRCDIYKIFVSL